MNAAACLKKAVAAGAELYVEAGRLRGRGARPEPELFAALREHEAEIVALLASRESATPASPPDELAYLPPSAAAGARKARQELAAEAREKAEFAARLGLPKDSTPPRAITPTDAPFGLSQRLVAAVAAAERSHVQFWLSDDVILQTQPPLCKHPCNPAGSARTLGMPRGDQDALQPKDAPQGLQRSPLAARAHRLVPPWVQPLEGYSP
jgi:hypothetical protein